jgi:uncharacterized linocin/CFP29 family protein
MNELMRNLAPIPEAAWQEIDQEATRVLRRTLAGRKVVDFSGPHGWQYSSVSLGRVDELEVAPEDGARARLRRVQPLVEVRVPFEMSRREIEAAVRGAADPELEPVTFAARKAALAEDRSIFHGFAAAGIEGIFERSNMLEASTSAGIIDYPVLVAEALDRLRIEGIDGPYGVVVGRECYTALATTHLDGYPVMRYIERLLDGPIVWAPGVDGAVVLSLRGGDFELTVGQDFSVGYLSHDADSVQLYIQESFIFRVLGPEAAVPLASICK